MSHPIYDRSGRRRSVTVAFRVSPEEAGRIDALVATSGLTKQDYIVHRLEDTQVIVIPNSRAQKGLSDAMARVYAELRRIERGSELSPDLTDLVATLGKTFVALNVKAPASDVDRERRAIRSLGREVPHGNEQ